MMRSSRATPASAGGRSRLVVASDAALRIAAAQGWLAERPANAEILVVAASWQAGDDLVRNAVGSAGARFGTWRTTLDRLASALSAPALAGLNRVPASRLSLVAVVARAVHRLRTDKILSYFVPIASQPGFPSALVRTLGELRMNGVDAGALETLADVGSDLSALATCVERELADAGLADRAAVYQAAIEAIEGKSPPHLVGLPLLLLDLPVTSARQELLVATLARRSGDVLATAATGDEAAIERLERALACKHSIITLGDRHGRIHTGAGAILPSEALFSAAVSTQDRLPRRATGSLDALKAHVFEETSPSVVSLDESVQLRSWPGLARECVEIAREIQRAAAAGTRFDRMAVALRSPSDYRPHLEEAFRRAALPAYFARGAVRPDPAGRALLALIACAAERLSARRFAEYLSLAQVPDPGAPSDSDRSWVPPNEDLLPLGGVSGLVSQPRAFPNAEMTLETPSPGPARTGEAGPRGESHPHGESGPQGESTSVGESIPRGESDARNESDPRDPVIEGTVPSPWRWERILVEASVIGGKDRWARRLRGLEAELRLRRQELAPEEEARAAQLDRQLLDLEHLEGCALPIIERLAAFPERATWGEWLEHLRALASAALREPTSVLETLAELEPMAPVGPIELDEVILVLGPRLRELVVPSSNRRYGAVFIASAEELRGLAFDVVFIPGLAEKIFPRKIVEDPILLDDARRALRASEVASRTPASSSMTTSQPIEAVQGLETQPARVGSERLALRLAVGAARERVVLSYPRLDVELARPRVPSFYGLEAIRAAEGRLPGFEELGARAEPEAGTRLGWPAPARPEDAIDEAEYDLALLAPLLDVDASTAVGTANYLLNQNVHLARALRARARRWLRRWTSADGLVDPDPDARAALARHQLSARSFSPTALQNFAACPYRFFLQAIHRLEPREEIEAIEIMDPLTRGSLVHEVQFELLSELRRSGMLPLDGGRVEPAIATLDAVLDRVAARYAETLAPAIPRVWDDAIQAVRADLREWLRRGAESREGWIPYRFELAFGLGDRDRPHADPASVPDAVPVGAGLQLRGSIDLVERHPRGTIRVTDHKTGRVRAGQDVVVGGGQVLQPVLYALAAERMLGEQVESGRLYYCTADGGYEERVVPLDATSRASAASVIEIIGQALAEGFLPAAPARGACAWCDYRPVCGPYEEIRTKDKPSKRLASLKRLREMP